MDRFESLPLIKLPHLEANDPTQLNGIQRMLWPYLSSIETFWWLVWWGILSFLVLKYLILPSMQNVMRWASRAERARVPPRPEAVPQESPLGLA